MLSLGVKGHTTGPYWPTFPIFLRSSKKQASEMSRMISLKIDVEIDSSVNHCDSIYG